MTASTKPHVIIAGAGIGGLVLAQCLRANNHPFTIFERDSSPHARSQGWAIALHTILADLVASVPSDMPPIDIVNHLLPFSDIQPQLSFYDARDLSQPARKFKVESLPATEVGYGPGRVIRANRDRLRDWLLTGIEVQWGKQMTSFSADNDGVTVHLNNNTTLQGSLLVGAEGARSSIRTALLGPDGPQLQNVPECFVTGEITLPKDLYEKQLQLSSSAYAIIAQGFHVFVGLNRIADDGQSAAYYWDLIWSDPSRASLDTPHWIDTASQEELYDFVLEKISGLDEKLVEIVKVTGKQGVKTPPLILRDMVLEGLPNDGQGFGGEGKVTLLGDAAHPMTPFRGEGGCHAIEDALRLARVLCKSEGSIQEYQTEMFERGSKAVTASRNAGNQHGNRSQGERRAWGLDVRPA